MSFMFECPFCNSQMTVPDEMSGQTAPCPKCGEEVFLDPADASRRREERRASSVRDMRAAAIASMPTTMPKVTLAWAFDFVLKISIAAAIIDGAIYALIYVGLMLLHPAR